MREKHLIQIVLGLNVALVGALAAYFIFSTAKPKRTSLSEAVGRCASSPTRPIEPPPLPESASDASQALPPKSVSVNASSKPDSGAHSNGVAAAGFSVEPPASATNRLFTWQEVESEDYARYLAQLRRVGCPEETVRRIALEDIDRLFAEKRLQVAVDYDPQWWRFESDSVLNASPRLLRSVAEKQAEDRRELIRKLLGPELAMTVSSQAMFWTDIQLTGPELGKLTPEQHEAVQRLCRQSMERDKAAYGVQILGIQNENPVERARLRELTRTELRRELNAEQTEAFLLRYSHNARQLREELRNFRPTPEEFRGLFRMVDPIDQAMQLEYGNLEAMSEKQRERWISQRNAAVKAILSPERFQAYLLTRDPLYRQAQFYAKKFGAPNQAIQPIYEVTKLVESKRKHILDNSDLSPQEKSKALQSISEEQLRGIQEIVGQFHRKSGDFN